MASAIEPETAQDAEPPTTSRHASPSVGNGDDGYARAQRSQFKFKSSKHRSNHDRSYRRHRHHSSHHRSKRRRTASPPDDDAPQPSGSGLPGADPLLDPDTAFRESLFDAMADDEGAQFWEGVYGQPLPREKPLKPDPVTGELERMTDEEYASYVRAEMYKKTHEYLLEEKRMREERRREREKQRREERRQEEEETRFRGLVAESLRRGRERRGDRLKAEEWVRRWKEYEDEWRRLGEPERKGEVKIPWPILRGGQDDVTREDVESFFLNGPTAGKPDQADLMRVLKQERVRWHPDKVQQKVGGRLKEEQLRAVTAVFQIIDAMWTELRDRKA